MEGYAVKMEYIDMVNLFFIGMNYLTLTKCGCGDSSYLA